MTRKLFLILTFSFLLTNIVYAEREEHYMPYPIVFVSGIRTKEVENKNERGSPSHTWPNTLIFKELKEYFVDGDGDYAPPKYDDKGSDNAGEVSHLEFLFFDARQDTLATNAGILRETIKNVLERYYKPEYTYTEPCSTPKVILVCHSLGGLIARYMLVNYTETQDKVAAVFFLGVPQEGSPLAAIGYFLPKEILALRSDIETIEDIIDSEDMEQWKKEQYLNMITQEEEKITGNLRFMQWAEADPSRGLYTSTRDQTDNDQLEAVLGKNFEETWGLPKVTEKGVIKAALIPDTSANTYRHTFKVYSNSGTFDILAGREALVRSVPENGPLTYDSTDPNVCELAGLGISLGKVQKVHAIVGNRYLTLRNGLYFRANEYIGWKNFESTDYSCIRNGFWDNGDGVSSLASQSEIGEVHTIDATHASWGVLGISLLTDETDHPDTPTIILQAIEDAPVIESVRFDELYNWFIPHDYITVKLRDYLLADIEVESLTADGVDLLSTISPEYKVGDFYKPYLQYGKDFLSERYYTEQVTNYYGQTYNLKFYLMPGEFLVRVNRLTTSNRKISIKIRNPAQKQASCAVYLFSSGSKAINKLGEASGGYNFNYPNDPYNTTWPQVKEDAYNNFLTAQEQIYTPGDGTYFGLEYLHAIGGDIYASSSERQSFDADKVVWSASQRKDYKHWLNFNLDIGSKIVKSIKFVGYGAKSLYTSKYNGSERSVEYNVPDFNILVYRDTSNTWPPPLNLQHDGDQFLFSKNTASFNNGEKIEFEIDPQYINLNGNNVWEFKSDLPDDSCIPDPPAALAGQQTEANYVRGAHIYYPALMVTFEENNP